MAHIDRTQEYARQRRQSDQFTKMRKEIDRLKTLTNGAGGGGGGGSYVHPNHSGEVTSVGDGATTIVNNAVTTAKILNSAVTNAKLDDMVAGTVKGRGIAAGNGAPVDLTASQIRAIINVADGANAYVHPNHSGEVTSVGDGATTIAANAVTTAKILDSAVTNAKIASDAVTTAKILNSAVTNAKLDDMVAGTVKGRGASAGNGAPVDLTASQIRAIINVADGANAYVHPNHSGEVTSVGDGATTIAANAVTTAKILNAAVTNAKLDDMVAGTVKGRGIAAGPGAPVDLTASQIAAITNGSLDHGGLLGLGDDDHAIYALLAGRAGGQTLSGDTAANGNLVLHGTSHATKTTSYLLLQPSGGRVGVGIAVPLVPFHAVGKSIFTDNMWVGAFDDTTPPSRLYVRKVGADGGADERGATIFVSAATSNSARTYTGLFVQSNPGGTNSTLVNEVGIEIALRGVQASGRPIALHADNGDMLLDAGRIGLGVSPANNIHIGPNTPSLNAYTGIWVAPATVNATVNVRNSGGQEVGLVANTNGNNYVGSWTNHPLILRSNNLDRITIAAGGAVTVTPAMTVAGLLTASGGLTLGGTIQGDDGNGGGIVALTKTGVAGTAVTIVSGVTKGVLLLGAIMTSGANSAAHPFVGLQGLGSSNTPISLGSSSFYFTVTAGGLFQVQRSAGTGTATVTVWAIWQ